MAYEMREGQGSLFKNDKEGNENRPDYRGEALIGGVVYSLGAWVKQGKSGKFMSLNIQPKQGKQSTGQVKLNNPGTGVATMDDMPDDLPF